MFGLAVNLLVPDTDVLHGSIWVPSTAPAPESSSWLVQTQGSSGDDSGNWVHATQVQDLEFCQYFLIFALALPCRLQAFVE